MLTLIRMTRSLTVLELFPWLRRDFVPYDEILLKGSACKFQSGLTALRVRERKAARSG